MENQLKKSEILFLYETQYNIPNGDPFTGEQRYDEETKNILVSDVRMKRFVRDYLDGRDGQYIYVQQKLKSIKQIENVVSNEEENDDEQKGTEKGSGSARRIDELISFFKNDIEEKKQSLLHDNIANKNQLDFNQALFVMGKCIDVRLFGGISTKKGNLVNLTGPVQFSLLNRSLNKINLRYHQITSCLESKIGNNQGAIGTTTIVPYSLVQIHGWVNPKVAVSTGMTVGDLKMMYKGLWYGTSGEGSSHSRSKIGQNSILLIEIEYAEDNSKIYGVDRLISITPKANKTEEDIRSIDDYIFDFSKLIDISHSTKVSKVRYYTELDCIKDQLIDDKFEEISFM